jgi:hypothetical protein
MKSKKSEATKQPMNMTRQPMNMTMESIGKRIYEDGSDIEEDNDGNLGDTQNLDLSHATQTNEEDWPFQCAICAEKFAKKQALHAHMRAHNEAKPHKCGECGLGFMHKGDVRRHCASIHHHQLQGNNNSTRQHICDMCSRAFARRSDLNEHKRRVHGGKSAESSGVTRISCQSCAQIFSSEKAAVRHLCSSSKAGGLGCEMCSAVLATRVEWGVHMWKHTKDAAFILTSETDPMPSVTKYTCILGE